MAIDLALIERLSQTERKTMLERFAKLSEESGELAQEILIAGNAAGFKHKAVGADGIAGEAVDVLIVAFSIFFKSGGTITELSRLLEKKCAKWEQWQQ